MVSFVDALRKTLNLNNKTFNMNIFVSNLSFKTGKEDIAKLFSTYGAVTTSRIILDKQTRRSKGYGFVEMSNDEEANAAINALNGTEYMGRTINVAAANPKPEAAK